MKIIVKEDLMDGKMFMIGLMIGALGGAVMVRANKPGFAFVLSAASLLGIILTPLLAMFPFVMPSSTMPNAGLTLWDCTSSQLTRSMYTFSTVSRTLETRFSFSTE